MNVTTRAASDPSVAGDQNKQRRLAGLTGLRSVAALMVFGTHANRLLLNRHIPLLSSVLNNGYVGVNFFFVLSGFILTWTHPPRDSAFKFYKRRFARVYPLYLCCLLIVYLLSKASAPPRIFGLDALLLQAWSPKPDIYLSINSVSWSLSAEAFFYLTFPFLIGVLQRLSTRRLVPVAIGAQIASIALGYLASGRFAVPLPIATYTPFLFGVVIGLAMKRGWRFTMPFNVAGSICALTYVGLSSFESAINQTVMTLAFALVVAAAASTEIANKRIWAAHQTLAALGVWSYAFYLIHLQVIASVQSEWAVPGNAVGLVCLRLSFALAISTGCAWLLCRKVELPAQRWILGLAPAKTKSVLT